MHIMVIPLGRIGAKNSLAELRGGVRQSLQICVSKTRTGDAEVHSVNSASPWLTQALMPLVCPSREVVSWRGGRKASRRSHSALKRARLSCIPSQYALCLGDVIE